ncbi:serine protease, partial [Streptomyces sp. A7024]|nr:serine protease [Streptomyces coryli]
NRPVPRHRIGPVIEALLAVERRKGVSELAARLEDLVQAVDTFARRDQEVREAYGESDGAFPVEPGEWWASRLLAGTLRKLPDAEPYLPVLRLLAERMLARAAADGGLAAAGAVLEPFGPRFWARLPLGIEHRLGLLRRLVPADPARPSAFLTAAGDLLRADPGAVQPLLIEWFNDDRALPGAEGATVADAAQALLHTLRGHAVDDLADVLLEAGHPRADQLLAALCEDETPAMCRAVDRWSHDPRPERHTAAAAYGMKTAPHARTAADRELLRYAAQALLALPEEWELYAPALVILVRNKDTRGEYLAHALTLFAAGDTRLPAASFVPALASDPEPVLDAFRARLHEPGPGAGEVLDALARVRTPATLARRAAALVREYATHRPEGAAAVARYFDRRLEDGAAARSVLHPLGVELITAHPPAIRRALAAVVAEPGTRASRPLRRELLAVLLDRERDPGVLDALLVAAASGSARRADWRTRDLVHRIGLLLASGASAAEGAAAFDLRLVGLAREYPGFGQLLRSWLDEAPEEWSAVIGPSAQVTLGPRQAG